jgi:hypothetical protein
LRLRQASGYRRTLKILAIRRREAKSLENAEILGTSRQGVYGHPPCRPLETISILLRGPKPVQPAIPQEPTSQLDEPEVVHVMLVVADQQSSALRQPGQGSFHDPSTSLPASWPARLTTIVSLRRVCKLGRRRRRGKSDSEHRWILSGALRVRDESGRQRFSLTVGYRPSIYAS